MPKKLSVWDRAVRIDRDINRAERQGKSSTTQRNKMKHLEPALKKAFRAWQKRRSTKRSSKKKSKKRISSKRFTKRRSTKRSSKKKSKKPSSSKRSPRRRVKRRSAR